MCYTWAMGRWILVVTIAGLVGVLSPRNADACDASGWQIDQQEAECLQIRSAEGTYRAANVCDGALTLTAEVCPAACPEAVEIAPGEDVLLDLPEDAKNDDSFRFVSTEGDVVSLLYVANECPSEDGCSFEKSGSRSGVGVFLIGVAIWGFRLLRKIAPGHRGSSRRERDEVAK